jgi:hypothetical protein
MLNYALTISLFLYSVYASHKSEQRIIDAIDHGHAEISKEINGLRPVGSDDVTWVVLKNAAVRARPDIKEKSSELLSPAQQIRLIREKGDWLYVEYFDYIEGVPKMGWIPKDCAARIKY